MLALQAAAGNRATSDLIRSAHPSPPALQRDNLDTAGAGYKVGGREQVELAWTYTNERTGIKVSFKVTASRKGSKVLESPTAKGPVGEATWSLGENKLALEKASKQWGTKLSSALGRADWSGGPIPGFPTFRVRVTGKGPEGKFDLTKGQADLDLLSVAVAADGDAIELLDWAGLAHLKDRVSVKASLEAKRGLSVADAARIKSALTAKEEVAAAAKEAEQHADDFAKQRAKLDAARAEEKRLARQLAGQRRAVEQARQSVESAKHADLRFSHHEAKLRRAELQLRKAQATLAITEDKITDQKSARKRAAGALKRAKNGLAEAGRKLQKAGHKLDGALKNVKSKLGEVAKKQIDKVSKGIMKKLGKTLLAKGLMKLIPGLNIASTLWDIGNLLWDVFGSKKSGKPGGGGGDGDASDDGEGDGGDNGGTTDQAGQEAGAGSGTAGDPGAAGGGTAKDPGTGTTGTGTTGTGTTGTGASGGPITKVQLSDRARSLVEAFAGQSVTLDDVAVEEINRGVPSDISGTELPQLIERLRAKGGGGLANPYELLAEISAELADLRAGKATIEFDGKPAEEVPDGPATMEPPRTLFPGTRQDVLNLLVHDAKSGQLALRQGFEKEYVSQVSTHPDGLQVKLASVEVTSKRPRGEADILVGTVAMSFTVHALPAGAAADYPYKVGETKEVKMTFLYGPKTKEWGEMDYSHLATFRSLITRTGGRWTLSGAGQTVSLGYADIKVTQLLDARELTGSDGQKLHGFLIEVVPIKVNATQAGYMTPQGWVLFKRGVAARIPFTLPD